MQNSFKIILYIDSNKNRHSERLAKEFKELGLVKSTSRFTSDPSPNIFITERHQIDAVWSSLNMIPSTSSITLFHFSIGDHRIIIIDFPIEFMIGDEFVLMAKLSMRRLISI